jgi:hypothetical protein
VWSEGLKAELKVRPNRLGLYFVAAYTLIAVAIFALIFFHSSPALGGKRGGLESEWIPFLMLAEPWFFVLPGNLGRGWLWILGFVLNGGILYLLGTQIEKFRRRIPSK